MTDHNNPVGKASGAHARPSEGGAAATATPTSLQAIGGSPSDAFNGLIARQTAAALYLNPQSDDDRRSYAQAALAPLISLTPKNELEGMLGAQLVACHNAAMECFRRAAHPGTRPEMQSENLAHAARLSRAYAALVEALDRRRGEGVPKTVTVEHRVIRETSEVIAKPAPHIGMAHKGNGHALNGHKAPNGTALR